MSANGVRRALHASTAGAAIMAQCGFWAALRHVLVLGTPVVIALELIRLRVPAWNRWIQAQVPVFRPEEAGRISGAAWLWAGFAAASWLPERAAVAGILVAALADPAASLVGSRFGRGARKSWSGTLAALVVAMAALFTLEIGWHGATLGAVVAAALERWPGPFDDNLLLAPGVAASVLILG